MKDSSSAYHVRGALDLTLTPCIRVFTYVWFLLIFTRLCAFGKGAINSFEGSTRGHCFSLEEEQRPFHSSAFRGLSSAFFSLFSVSMVSRYVRTIVDIICVEAYGRIHTSCIMYTTVCALRHGFVFESKCLSFDSYPWFFECSLCSRPCTTAMP